LEGGFQGGVAVLAFVNEADEIDGSNEAGEHFILADFDPADFSGEAIDAWVLLFEGWGYFGARGLWFDRHHISNNFCTTKDDTKST
jgi:hypothetical protein